MWHVHPHDPLQSCKLLFLQILEETHFGFSYGTSNPIQADPENNLEILVGPNTSRPHYKNNQTTAYTSNIQNLTVPH
ncbi:unnamed protein product [Timema podura]|uniref:Uncharacterized protein n=1 Tax=Timema podura TaxID=61482 RepID=A0ABN7P4I9_TIMPD|nr:unnamed protein product [Timema podura]